MGIITPEKVTGDTSKGSGVPSTPAVLTQMCVATGDTLRVFRHLSLAFLGQVYRGLYHTISQG